MASVAVSAKAPPKPPVTSAVMRRLFPEIDGEWSDVNMNQLYVHSERHCFGLDMKRPEDQSKLLKGLQVGGFGENRARLWAGFENLTFGNGKMIHLGADISGMQPGEVVCSLTDGVVHHIMHDTSPTNGWGWRVIIRSADCDVLYGHLRAPGARPLKVGSTVKRGQAIGTIGDASENGGWFPHLHLQRMSHAYTDSEKDTNEIDGYNKLGVMPTGVLDPLELLPDPSQWRIAFWVPAATAASGAGIMYSQESTGAVSLKEDKKLYLSPIYPEPAQVTIQAPPGEHVRRVLNELKTESPVTTVDLSEYIHAAVKSSLTIPELSQLIASFISVFIFNWIDATEWAKYVKTDTTRMIVFEGDMMYRGVLRPGALWDASRNVYPISGGPGIVYTSQHILAWNLSLSSLSRADGDVICIHVPSTKRTFDTPYSTLPVLKYTGDYFYSTATVDKATTNALKAAAQIRFEDSLLSRVPYQGISRLTTHSVRSTADVPSSRRASIKRRLDEHSSGNDECEEEVHSDCGDDLS